MEQEPVVWQTVEWRQGDGGYRFELQQGGLHATLTAPQGRSFTMPTVAWYALFDALAASRKTRQRSERPMPARSNARWGETEAGDLIAAFKSGASFTALAKSHNRSAAAIEAQLARLGLWHRMEARPLMQDAIVRDGDIRDGNMRDTIMPDTTAAASMPVADAKLSPDERPWPPDDWDLTAPLPREAVVATRTDAGGRLLTAR